VISYLAGKVLENSEGTLAVFTGSLHQGGVGYSVHVPKGTLYTSISKQSQIELFIYTHVRQDVFDLYGFMTYAEKDLFLCLLNVNGVGPKAALSILSQVDVDHFTKIILSKNADELTEIPGIGKKTAERLILELFDPLKKKGSLVERLAQANEPEISTHVQALEDAKTALIGLGYKEQEIAATLKKIAKDSAKETVEDLIKQALRHLG
jgi:Holliday junction DNA helicase RuvA